MFAYNATTHSSTGYSPFFLLFGREAHLPIDTIIPVDSPKLGNKSYQQFVKQWKDAMQEAFKIAISNSQKQNAYNKKQYDKKVKYVDIQVGDRVLIKNDKDEKGVGRKLKSYWQEQLYEVIQKHPTLPLLKITMLAGP